jgi:arylsulfatase A-like enzyme
MNNDHPNILLVVVDCGRSDRWVGAGRSSVTPNVDRLGREGVVFPTTIVEESCTTPSFTTLLTGLYSPRHGVYFVWGYRLADNVRMLTEVLAEHGYHTYAEVSGPLLPEMGLERGFESYEYRAPCDYLHTAWGDRLVERLRSGHYRRPWFMMLHLWEVHFPRQIAPEHNNAEHGAEEYDRAVSSLDAQLGRLFEAAGENTLIAFTGDHGERSGAETFREGTAVSYARKLLRVDEAEGMPLFKAAYWTGPSVLQQLYSQVTPLVKDIPLRDMQRAYTAGRWARFRDRLRLLRLMPRIPLYELLSLGTPLKLTSMIKRRGLLDETRARGKVERFVRSLGQEKLIQMHMRMWINCYKKSMREGHGIHLYDFLVRVPLVLRWPEGLPAGAVHNRMIRQPDILPTILDAIGIDRERIGDVDGRSVRPLIEGRPWEPLPAYVSLPGLPADLELRGVRTERYKYTFGPKNPELPQELYDLVADPGETNNLADKEPARCAELREIANNLVPGEGHVPVEQITVDVEQQQRIETRLRDLGYID